MESSGLCVRDALARLDIAPTTYYRWRRFYSRRGLEGLQDKSPHKGRTWNQLLPREEDKIFQTALLSPELSPRELAFQITDQGGFSVSESTV